LLARLLDRAFQAASDKRNFHLPILRARDAAGCSGELAA
jgi:hypothetical protein